MDKQALLKYFHAPDDRLLFTKVIDQAYLCLKKRADTFTDFLDPVKADKMLTAFKKFENEFSVGAFGGFEGAERLMLGFFYNDEYTSVPDACYPITALKAEFDPKFAKSLTHRDFLGAVLGVGIDRGKVGDIVIKQDFAVIFAKSDIADFIVENMAKAGRTGLCVKPYNNLDEVSELFVIEPVEERRITVSSLRIDAVIGAVFALPRSQAAEIIGKEKAFINWTCVQGASKNIATGDIITVRGFGRIKVLEILGTTKKDKIAVRIVKY